MKPKLTYCHTVGIVTFFCLFFGTFPVFSETSSAKLQSWVAALKVEAESRGVTRFVLDNALKNFVPIKRVIELDRRQPEFTLTFKQYLSRVMPNSRIKKGRQKLKENKKVLALIQAKYGVQ
ncbi:MAG: lytic murein transglycosylase, partial [Pseudomonadota bacterium]|nr:lytic murein transglycosylase [Pseudomonadota bacterium]